MRHTENFRIPIPEKHDQYNIDEMMKGYQILDKEVGQIKRKTTSWDKSTRAIKHYTDYTIKKDDYIRKSGYYVYSIGNASITTNSRVHVYVHLDSLRDAKHFLPVVKSTNGRVEIYSKAKLLKNIILDYTIFTEVK